MKLPPSWWLVGVSLLPVGAQAREEVFELSASGAHAVARTRAASTRAARIVPPLEKALELIGGIKQKAEQEKHEETIQYAAFEQFCGDVTLEKQQAIALADSEMAKLAADAQKFATGAQGLEGEIAVHHTEIAGWTEDAEKAAEVRGAEQEDYLLMRQNYTESIDALIGAIDVLKAQQYDREGAFPGSPAALLEGRAREEPDLAVQGPPVTAYEFRSGDIVKLLEDLREKFKDELHTLEKAEVDRHHAFTMFKQGCEKSIAAGEDRVNEKTATAATYKQQADAANADLQMVGITRADDAKYLTDLTATCKQKATEYADRQQIRMEEIQALEKAMELLKSEEVAGVVDKDMSTSLLAQVRGTAFVQLRKGQEPRQQRLVEFLRDASARLQSSELSALAMMVQNDPFGKVKVLIEELIQRLMTQATRETEHKGWCDKEMATNAHTRKTMTEKIETLAAEIDSLAAETAQLTKEVAQLLAEVDEIDAAVENATKLRGAEHNESQVVIADAQQAQAAVGRAIHLLRDFYNKAAAKETVNASADTVVAAAANGSSLLQAQPEPPPIFPEGSYEGQQAASSGVIGILDVIQSDFARLESDAKAAEQASNAAYNQFMEDSAVSKAQKQSDVKHKDSELLLKGEALPERRHDLQKAHETLAATEVAYEKLKPACIAEPMSWEERKSRREDEIEALKQALDILSEAVPQ